MVKRSRIIFVIAILLLSLYACSAQTVTQSASNQSLTEATPATKSLTAGSSSFGPATSPSTDTTSANSATTTDRMIVTNASLSIVVTDPAKTLQFITNLASQQKGFVVSSNLYQSTDSDGTTYPSANITIRVPAAILTDVINQVKSQTQNSGTDVTSETISGQDITKEYTDLQSQLDNLQAANTQLQKIMDSTTNVTDTLSVYNQLVSVRSQIEVLQGEIKYDDEAVSLSSLSVNITAKASVKPITIAGWQPVGIARNAVQALLVGLKVLANVLIWAVLFGLPLLIIIGVPFYFIRKGIRKLRANRKDKVKPPQTLA